MKLRNPLTLLAAWLGFVIAPAPAVKSAVADFGGVTGQIRNAQTGAFLEGAVVEATGANRATLTERDGRFRISGLPAGQVTLQVSYTGLDPQEVRVNVPAGGEGAVDVALTSSAYQMAAFQVSELREGNAMALTEQRNAMNVKNVVATDAFGHSRDGNVAELLVLLPGVVGNMVGNDIRSVMIRGMDSNLGSVTLDGLKMANAESGATERTFEWDVISDEHVDAVEVIKAPTPDMEADSVGGTINLKTKSAFNFSGGRRLSSSVGMSYDTAYNRSLPTANFSYSEVLGADRRLGVSFNWGYSEHNVGRIGTALTYPTVTTIPNNMLTYRVFDQESVRVRSGGGLKLDYKLSDNTTVYVNSLVGFYNEAERRFSNLRRFVVQTNAASVAAGYTDDRVVWNPTANTSAGVEIIGNPKHESTWQVGTGLRHRFGPWKFEIDGSVSHGQAKYDAAKYRLATMTATLTNIGLTLDRTNTDKSFPAMTQTSGPDMYNLANYRAGTISQLLRGGADDMAVAQASASRDFDVGFPLTVKGGVKYRVQQRKSFLGTNSLTYLGPDGLANSGDESLLRFAEDHQRVLGQGRYGTPTWFSSRSLGEAIYNHPEWFLEDPTVARRNRLANDRKIEESIPAGYLMANAKFGKLGVLTGVRYESTRDTGRTNAHEITPAEAARRAAYVGTVTTAEALRRIDAEYSKRITRTKRYDNFFPSLHLKYEPLRNLIVRASYATAIGRPNFASIIPDTDINNVTQRITTNNTDLKPQIGKSTDLSVEYYFKPMGLISAGLFHKSIGDFIFSSTSVVGTGPDNGYGGEYAGYTTSTQANGGNATVKGFELNYMQQLTFLPGLLRDFSVFGNYTHLTTRGNYGGTTAAPTTELVGFVPTSGNAGISFSRWGLDARIKATYKGEWLTAFSTNAGAVRWTKARTNLDVNLLYNFNRRYSIFFDWANILKVADNIDYQFRPALVRSNNPTGSRLNLGVRARL